MSILLCLREEIQQRLAEAAYAAQEAGELDFGAKLPSFTLEVPREKNHGDFAANLALLLTKPARQAPRKIAALLVQHFSAEGTAVSRLEIAGPGFINFFLDPFWVHQIPEEVLQQGRAYGRSTLTPQPQVQVEFVSANPTGPLHVGHARGAALGDSLANLLEAAGYAVSREFYVNDAGNQIAKFADSLVARYLEMQGQEVDFPEDGYHGQDLIQTVQNYQKQTQESETDKLDPEARKAALVQFALTEKLREIRETLASFGVEFSLWFSEQSLHDSGKLRKTMDQLGQQGYLVEKEQAQWFQASRLNEELKDEVLVRSNGLPTYFLADIAYHQDKFQRGFDLVINIWGADHHGHVARLKGALEALALDPAKLEVILAQMVRLFQGGEQVRMSKRTGQYVTLEELLEEVGRDAARYFFIMRAAESHLDFDLDLAKSQSNENPVYYIQYAHARICSILRQAAEAGIPQPTLADCSLTCLRDPAELELLGKIAELPVEIRFAAESREPHRIARYIHELAALFHHFYNANRVLVEDTTLRDARLILVQTVQITLQNVLGILGIHAPERM